MPLTEEINLDEEIRKQEATLRQPQAKVKRKSKLKLPTSSPFELSESDAGASRNQKSGPKPAAVPDSSDFELAPAAPKDDSSDFDLVPPATAAAVYCCNRTAAMTSASSFPRKARWPPSRPT